MYTQKQIEKVEISFGKPMLKLVEKMVSLAEQKLHDDVPMLYSDLIDALCKNRGSMSVTGDNYIWADDTGDVVYDEQGELLLDMNGKPLDYDEQGNLLNKKVSAEVLAFVKQHTLSK